jgi:hypothetical protein
MDIASGSNRISPASTGRQVSACVVCGLGMHGAFAGASTEPRRGDVLRVAIP